MEGKRRKGRLKRRWMDSVNVEKGLSGAKPGCVEETCQVHRSHIEVRKHAEEEGEEVTQMVIHRSFSTHRSLAGRSV